MPIGKKIINDAAIKNCGDILFQNQHVSVAYFFGSRAGTEYHAGSDLDLAIFTDKEFSTGQYLDLLSLLTQTIKSDKLDLVWLNKAKPLMKHEVIKNGKVLFYNDPEILNDFESRPCMNTGTLSS